MHDNKDDSRADARSRVTYHWRMPRTVLIGADRQDDDEPDTLLAAADRQLYRAKDEGRNRVTSRILREGT